jgi:ADP-ribosylglycohydrolase
MNTTGSIDKALLSLEGLSTGDAFGELFFKLSPYSTLPENLPRGLWHWTDDTHMALSIVEVLKSEGRIEQDVLAKAFARRFNEEPYRGYAGGAIDLLRKISKGSDWRDISPKLFGTGSFGNGAAMRVAPIGAFFYQDIQLAAEQAQLSAVITHAHIEGQAGAIAVAVAAALAANKPYLTGQKFLGEILKFVPETLTRDLISKAMVIDQDQLHNAMRILGTGIKVSAQDTVPFCLWSAAHHLDNFENALWHTVKGLGDCDTTCAIVGGIVALSAPEIPGLYLNSREPIHL